MDIQGLYYRQYLTSYAKANPEMTSHVFLAAGMIAETTFHAAAKWLNHAKLHAHS